MTRTDKYVIFKQFFDASEQCFNKFNENYKPHKELRNLHGYYVAPGSTNGGLNETVVEILFGHRPHRKYVKYENGQKSTCLDVAYGSRLVYQQIDTGNVLVILYPAITEKQKAKEKFIIIEHVKKVNKLLQQKYIYKHYKLLVSYLAATSIECNPSWIDKHRISLLRLTSNMTLLT